MRIKLTLVFAASVSVATAAPLAVVKSPDGNVLIKFTLQPDGAPAYAIDYLGKSVVLESRLGLEPAFASGFKLAATTAAQHSGSWTKAFSI